MTRLWARAVKAGVLASMVSGVFVVAGCAGENGVTGEQASPDLRANLENTTKAATDNAKAAKSK